ncbi:cell envelope integrity protein TolA [Legionella maioricensis]|uniref:Cell envelope integrity protein TolA n=1 Tax=Legionella maioricensis TaxID=2896528 RepID=A0A9X2IC55_9GAMM|nr:cell envelope integrity protein TolA [Legionella maioricensis]MCL9685564.1 cell envelope integrity protein TolA [Legionella maioricensis]MCL9688933.1 cell envelope integrity protein TolA [Legionella maioricensis]
MISTPSYRKAFFSALALHLFLIVMLLTDTTASRPVLQKETQNTPGMELPVAAAPQPEIVKAVSVDNKAIMETVNRLKQEREQKQRAELNRQKELNRQVALAKQQRIKEQQQLAKLKEEANKIAIARKKQAEEEKKHLKELAEQKALEAKRIEELKKQKEKLVKQQELEAKKLAELNKKKAEDKAKADKLKAEQAHAEKVRAEKAAAEQAKADMERKKQADAAAAQQARQNAENQARIAGEVDKYKALIVNAIGRNWILPENVDSSLSSQFRIRLASDGTVLDVSLTRSSGDPLLDRSAQTAIFKASPLPVPTDAETFNLFRDISLTVRPEQVRG